jgi:hypothetical protein
MTLEGTVFTKVAFFEQRTKPCVALSSKTTLCADPTAGIL